MARIADRDYAFSPQKAGFRPDSTATITVLPDVNPRWRHRWQCFVATAPEMSSQELHRRHRFKLRILVDDRVDHAFLQQRLAFGRQLVRDEHGFSRAAEMAQGADDAAVAG